MMQQQINQLTQQFIARMSIKPVPFLKDEPDIYFIQLEAQFHNFGLVPNQTRYDHKIAQFDPKYLQMVTDLLRDPPATGYYPKCFAAS